MPHEGGADAVAFPTAAEQTPQQVSIMVALKPPVEEELTRKNNSEDSTEETDSVGKDTEYPKMCLKEEVVEETDGLAKDNDNSLKLNLVAALPALAPPCPADRPGETQRGGNQGRLAQTDGLNKEASLKENGYAAAQNSRFPAQPDVDNRPKETVEAFSKTRRCKYFDAGWCRQGNDCEFAHGQNEIRDRPDLFRTELCFRYQQTGRCSYGDRCRFAHGEKQLMQERPSKPKYPERTPPWAQRRAHVEAFPQTEARGQLRDVREEPPLMRFDARMLHYQEYMRQQFHHHHLQFQQLQQQHQRQFQQAFQQHPLQQQTAHKLQKREAEVQPAPLKKSLEPQYIPMPSSLLEEENEVSSEVGDVEPEEDWIAKAMLQGTANQTREEPDESAEAAAAFADWQQHQQHLAEQLAAYRRHAANLQAQAMAMQAVGDRFAAELSSLGTRANAFGNSPETLDSIGFGGGAKARAWPPGVNSEGPLVGGIEALLAAGAIGAKGPVALAAGANDFWWGQAAFGAAATPPGFEEGEEGATDVASRGAGADAGSEEGEGGENVQFGDSVFQF